MVSGLCPIDTNNRTATTNTQHTPPIAAPRLRSTAGAVAREATRENEMKRSKVQVAYVKWDELSNEAKQRLLTEGDQSCRPTIRDQRREANRFAADGSSWQDSYALAGFFSVPIRSGKAGA